MPNGPEQEARDRLFLSRLGQEDEINELFPSRWSVHVSWEEGEFVWFANVFCRTCPVVQPWLYGYDADNEVANAVKQNPDFKIEKASL